MRPKRPANAKSDPKAGPSSPKLRDEDEALWSYAAQTIHPVRAMKPRVPATGPAAERGEHGHLRHQTVIVDAEKPAPVSSEHPRHMPPHPVRPKPGGTPPLAEFDRRKARRIAAGKLEIDARLDLHGMRQAEAHQYLRGFLLSCAARGLSTVLVITGKGGRETDEPRPFDQGHEGSGRGVLKRVVPHWLAEPDLRAVVVSFREAGIRHGGDGALYVQLRKRKG